MAKFLSTTALLTLLIATTATAQWAVKLPPPTGPDAVGATRFSLLDTARPETFTEDRSDHRELLIRVWYPAKPAPGAQPEPFWGRETQEIATRMAEFMRLPKGAFDRFNTLVFIAGINLRSLQCKHYCKTCATARECYSSNPALR